MTEAWAAASRWAARASTAETYAEFVAKEYLADYVRGGGAAVRFVVAGSDDVARRWHQHLAAAAADEGYLHVAVDAADVRVHMIDQLYAAVARQVDWSELARGQVRGAGRSSGLPAPESGELSVAPVAEHHDVDQREAAAACAGCWRAPAE